MRDLCEIAAQLPELYSQPLGMLQNKDVAACRIEEPWLWAWRGLANYIVPKIDVQVSGILRSQPNVLATNDPGSNGLSQSANYFEQAANVVAQLGRPVAGNAPQVTLDLARLGDVYPARLNTVDMRVSKIVRIRSHPCQRGLRPLQPVQRQHRHRVQPELRDQRRRLAAAERDSEPAVRAV